MAAAMQTLMYGSMDFYTLLAQVKQAGRKFNAQDLQLLSYEQLPLAAMGNAGTCRCSLADVIHERQARRVQIVVAGGLDWSKPAPPSLTEDIAQDQEAVNADIPRWDDLSTLAKLSFKLSCLESHPHHAEKRLGEAILLIDKSPEYHISLAPLKLALQRYLTNPSDDDMQKACARATASIYDLLSDAEQTLVLRFELRDYRCCMGCFQPGYSDKEV